MKAKIQEAIKSARDKNKGKIAPSKDIYEAIFKAGRDEHIEEVANMYEVGIDRGRKEVVEWIASRESTFWNTLYIRIKVSIEEYENKLKEWGLK